MLLILLNNNLNLIVKRKEERKSGILKLNKHCDFKNMLGSILSWIKNFSNIKHRGILGNKINNIFNYIKLKKKRNEKVLIPICARCKRIRNSENHWETIEEYVTKNFKAEFTHDICPRCMKELYPNVRMEEISKYK